MPSHEKPSSRRSAQAINNPPMKGLVWLKVYMPTFTGSDEKMNFKDSAKTTKRKSK